MTPPAPSFARFVIIWFGQFVSLTGSSLSSFALGVFVYRQTGSATALGLVFALGFLPMIAASPIAGPLVDRWGSRRALLVSNVGAMALMGLLALALMLDSFAPWQLYAVVAATSLLRALQIPAFEAAVPLLAPKRHLGRANGMQMVALASSQVVAPAAAGALLLAVDVSGIVLIDCLSFGVALLTLAAVRIPRPAEPEAEPGEGRTALLDDFRQAAGYVAARPGLTSLLAFIGALNFAAGIVDLLITPLVLSFASARDLGVVMSLGGLGMVVAGVAMSIWGGPRRRVRGVLGFSAVMGLATVLGSLRPDVVLVTVAAALFLGSLAIVIGSNQGIWQSQVRPQMLGRVMALQNMVATTPQLVGYALAGLADDHVFGPLVGDDPRRHPLIAALVGTGPGRGTALLLMVSGVFVIGVVAIARFDRRLRDLDRDQPDLAADPHDPHDPHDEAAAARSL